MDAKPKKKRKLVSVVYLLVNLVLNRDTAVCLNTAISVRTSVSNYS